MQDKFTQFFTLLNNELGTYADQCVQVSNLWSRFIGGPFLTGSAIDLNKNAGDFYDWVDNTPDNFPLQGDIVVFGSPYGLINGKYYGHTGVCTGKADKNTVELLEQNDPSGSSTHLNTYNYIGCLGWLHCKALQSPPTAPQEVTDQTIVHTISDGDIEWQKARSMLEDRKKAMQGVINVFNADPTQVPPTPPVIETTTGALNVNVVTKPSLLSRIKSALEVLFGNHAK